MDEKSAGEMEIKLYELLVEQLQKYNTIIWQFPIAVLAGDALALDKPDKNALLPLVVGIVGIPLAYAFRRLVSSQRVLIKTTRKAETALGSVFRGYIPHFEPHKRSATTGVAFVLWAVPIGLIVYSLARLGFFPGL